MPAYFIANVEITDPAEFEAYRRAVPAVIAAHGGRYLVRGGATEVLEGDPGLKRVVILEFPDVAAARAFYASPDYAPLLAQRLRAARSSVAILEGHAP
jgi:uncharacterized protein (DUF1330 family)